MHRLRILFLLYALGACLAIAQKPAPKQPPPQAKPVYPYTHGFLASLNGDVQYACAFAGTPAQQLTAAMSSIPPTGGQLDSFCLSGPQAISSNIWTGFTKDIVWWLGTSAFTVNANATIPSNIEICYGPGGSIAAGATFTLVNNASPCLGGGSSSGCSITGITSLEILYDNDGACAGIPTSEVDVTDTRVLWQYYESFGNPFGSLDPTLTDLVQADNVIADITTISSIGLGTNLGVYSEDDGIIGTATGLTVNSLETADEDTSIALTVNGQTTGSGGAYGAIIYAEACSTSISCTSAASDLHGLLVYAENFGTGVLLQQHVIETGDATEATTYAEDIQFLGGLGLYEFGDWTEPGTDTLLNITSESTNLPGEGFTKNCSDCDTPLTEGAVCTAAGDHAGAQAVWIRAALHCF